MIAARGLPGLILALALVGAVEGCTAPRASEVPTAPFATEARVEHLEVQWWQEWERRHKPFCPGWVGSARLAMALGAAGSMCWGASFRGRIEIGERQLVAPSGTLSALVTCTSEDGSTDLIDHWTISEETSPGLYDLAGDGSGRLLALLDDRTPARVRLYDARGRVERELSGGAGREDMVWRARLLPKGGVLLRLSRSLVALAPSAERWTVPLPALGADWVAITPSGAIYATYSVPEYIGYPAVLARFSRSGEIEWQTVLDGLTLEDSGQLAVTSVALAADDSVVLVGTFRRPLRFGARTVRPRYASAAYVARVETDGAPNWFRSIDAEQDAFPLSVAVDQAGMISVLVGYRGRLEVEPAPPETDSDGLALLRFDSRGEPTLAWGIPATPMRTGSISVDARGDLWFQLRGVSLDAALGGAGTAQAYDPRSTTATPPDPWRCMLMKASVVHR